MALSIIVRNVNEALPLAMLHLRHSGIPEVSRDMATLEYPEPVITTYWNPMERVLFLPERDANPFFHLFESLWILGGRQDVAFLQQFNSRISEYSDNGKIFHGAYGFRLRHNHIGDQIEEAIDLLAREPNTRRCVLQIWDANRDLGTRTKDTPCNTMVYFKIRGGALNMTVCNRSNDVIWGAYGANVVQFSVLQEYVANRVGVGVGRYHQMSDSFHVYPDNPQWAKLKDIPVKDDPWYASGKVRPYPLGVDSAGHWDQDLRWFLEDPFGDAVYETAYFNDVVQPLALAWLAHKEEKNGAGALDATSRIDWVVAARAWLLRREAK